MKWEEVIKSYPRISELFSKFILTNNNLLVKRRCLYDFFDSQGLFIEVRKKFTKCKYVINGNNISLASRYVYNSRRYAEDAAFKRCFNVLENKLQLTKSNEKICNSHSLDDSSNCTL